MKDTAVREELYKMQDKKYRELQIKIIPNIDPDSIIGVRTPELKKYAKQLAASGVADAFLNELPHKYFEENQLHSFVLSGIKDYEKCMSELDRFLPHVDNWATCDQLSPKVFKKHKGELLDCIKTWIKSDDTYVIRFAIKMLMDHFLDEDYKTEYPKMVAKVRSDEYYVNMMLAWYFATALAKQYDTAVTFIEQKELDKWTHNKAIQKSIESYRISPEKKEYLRSLKIR